MLEIALTAMLAAGRSQEDRVQVYGWLGAESTADVAKPKYVDALRAAFAGQDVTAEAEVKKKWILDTLPKADVVVAAVHSGYSELDSGGRKEMTHWIRTERGDPPGSPLTAFELFRLRQSLGEEAMPRLLLIAGCNLLSYPEKGPRVLRIPEALGIGEWTKGRAVLGFDTLTIGIVADDVLLAVLEEWTRKGAGDKYPTLREAQAAAIRALQPRSKAAAGLAENLKIHGDAGLRYSDLLRYPAVKRHLRALKRLGLKAKPELERRGEGREATTTITIEVKSSRSQDEPGMTGTSVEAIVCAEENTAKAAFEPEREKVLSDRSRFWERGSPFRIDGGEAYGTHRSPTAHTMVNVGGRLHGRFGAKAEGRRGKAVLRISLWGLSKEGFDPGEEGRRAADQKTKELGIQSIQGARELLEKLVAALEARE